jgi:hypothetical protein
LAGGKKASITTAHRGVPVSATLLSGVDSEGSFRNITIRSDDKHNSHIQPIQLSAFAKPQENNKITLQAAG